MSSKQIHWITFQQGLMASYWQDIFRKHHIHAECRVIHHGFDAITGRGPYPETFEIWIPAEESEKAMQVLEQALDWPEPNDPIFACSEMGLAYMAHSEDFDRISQALARKLWKRLYGSLPDFL